MPRLSFYLTTPVLALSVFTSAANAGPDCIEGVTDAGSLRSSARVCSGTGPLGMVVGQIAGGLSTESGPIPDREDMYLIQITDAVNFSARTDGPPGSANFDTQLWLFRLENSSTNGAFGVLANDEILGGPVQRSHLRPPATDGTGQTIPGPGLYLLAVTGFNNDPLSADGAIFNQALTTEVSGPDGPGGAQIHTAWTGGGVVGSYAIHLTGAARVPPVPALTPLGGAVLTLLVLSGAAVVFRRTRCGAS